jgi:hypothetical protein
MSGKLSPCPLVSAMSADQARWDSTVSTLTPMIVVSRSWKSFFLRANSPSSVVHTGVKSAGCENRRPPVAQVVMEANRALRGVGVEVRGVSTSRPTT